MQETGDAASRSLSYTVAATVVTGMWFGLLGPLLVTRDRQDITPTAPKLRLLLALLLVHPNEVVPAGRLIDEIWGARAPRTVATSLQLHILKLRRQLGSRGDETGGGQRLVTHPGGYLLAVHDHELDVARFRAMIANGRCALAQGDVPAAAETFREALALWRGPALADVSSPVLDQVHRPALEEQRTAVLEQRIDCDLILGRHSELVGELTALLAVHPLREGFAAQLMLALYRTGRRTDALETYRRTRRILRDEIGVEPGARLQALHRAVLASESSLEPEPRPVTRVGASPTCLPSCRATSPTSPVAVTSSRGWNGCSAAGTTSGAGTTTAAPLRSA